MDWPSTASWGSARAPRCASRVAPPRPRAAALATPARGDGEPRARVDTGAAPRSLRTRRARTPPPPSVPTDDRSSDVVAAVVLWGLPRGLRRAGHRRAGAPGRLAPGRGGPARRAGAGGRGPGPGVGQRGRQRLRAVAGPAGDGVIGYLTTSTDAWSDADEGSAAAIEATCEDSAWDLLEIVCDRENGRDPRPPGAELRAGADRRGAGPRPRGQRPAAPEPLAR